MCGIPLSGVQTHHYFPCSSQIADYSTWNWNCLHISWIIFIWSNSSKKHHNHHHCWCHHHCFHEITVILDMFYGVFWSKKPCFWNVFLLLDRKSCLLQEVVSALALSTIFFFYYLPHPPKLFQIPPSWKVGGGGDSPSEKFLEASLHSCSLIVEWVLGCTKQVWCVLLSQCSADCCTAMAYRCTNLEWKIPDYWIRSYFCFQYWCHSRVWLPRSLAQPQLSWKCAQLQNKSRSYWWPSVPHSSGS